MTEAPDLILTGGPVRTLDPRQPMVRAIAISRGRIRGIGGEREMAALAGPGTRFVQLDGRSVIPGMFDSHFHYYDWAVGRRELALADAVSLDDLLDRVARAAENRPAGAWIVGGGWNEADWPEPRMPDRKALDAVAPGHPTVLWRCDLHLAAVNSPALAAAGIDAATPDPPEGIIGRDPDGRPDGLLREMAVNRIKDALPSPDPDTILTVMRDGIRGLHALGITAIEDVKLMDDPNAARTLSAWQGLRAADALDLRCWVSLPADALDAAISLGLRTGFGDDRLRIGHVKFFADGGMGARTAWMIDPYLDADRGMPLLDMAEFREAVRRADAAGLSVMVHAIGDQANREVVDAFAAVPGIAAAGTDAAYPTPLLPHRIEHAQMIRPADINRIAALKLAVCMQPSNLILDIRMIDDSVRERGRWTYAFRSFQEARVPLLFSSDAPVCDPNPLMGIHAAVTRTRRDGSPEGGFYPDQRVSVEGALRAYTAVPAAYYGLAHELGTITPGKRADLVVLDRDLFEIDPATIPDVQVGLTLFDGRVVYENESAIRSGYQ